MFLKQEQENDYRYMSEMLIEAWKKDYIFLHVVLSSTGCYMKNE
jgi:hypothetical protein